MKSHIILLLLFYLLALNHKWSACINAVSYDFQWLLACMAVRASPCARQGRPCPENIKAGTTLLLLCGKAYPMADFKPFISRVSVAIAGSMVIIQQGAAKAHVYSLRHVNIASSRGSHIHGLHAGNIKSCVMNWRLVAYLQTDEGR